MSITPDPGKTPERAPLRRRVIVELTVEELPLLEAARMQHGTTRRAVLEALRSAGEVEDLRARLARAETQTKASRARRADKENEERTQPAAERKRIAELEREVKRADDALAAAAAEQGKAQDCAERLESDLEELAQALEERGTEIDALHERAVDELYCARCEQLVPPEEWSWRAAKGGSGSVAYHERCGDHGPGILGASSWLALRDD